MFARLESRWWCTRAVLAAEHDGRRGGSKGQNRTESVQAVGQGAEPNTRRSDQRPGVDRGRTIVAAQLQL